jgi:hypothetical protein
MHLLLAPKSERFLQVNFVVSEAPSSMLRTRLFTIR